MELFLVTRPVMMEMESQVILISYLLTLQIGDGCDNKCQIEKDYYCPTAGGACQPCSNTCVSCFGPGQDVCEACNSNVAYELSTNKCRVCHSNCVGCSAAGNSACTACSANSFKDDITLAAQSKFICQSSCPAGLLQDNQEKKCVVR